MPENTSTPEYRTQTRDVLFTFDAMLNELEAMIHVLCDLREDHLSHGEPMREEQVELANTSLWGAELGLSRLHDHYRSLVDKAFKERRGEQ